MPYKYIMENAEEWYIFTKDFGEFKCGERYELGNLILDQDTSELVAYDFRGRCVKRQPIAIVVSED